MNQDGQDFLDALDGVDSAVAEQQTAQPERSGEIEVTAGRLDTVASEATEAQTGLSTSQTEGQALASRNDARAADSRQRESQAGGAAQRLGGQAADTRTEIDSLTEQWRTWASAHRQARLDAMLQTRSAMLARGWQPREESQGVGG